MLDVSVLFLLFGLTFSVNVNDTTENQEEECALDVRVEGPSAANQPIFFRRQGSIVTTAIPISEDNELVLVFKKREKIVAVCSGPDNELVVTHQSRSEIQCGSNPDSEVGTSRSVAVQTSQDSDDDGIQTREIPEGAAETFAENCTKPVVAEIKPRMKNSRCAGYGKYYEIGYKFEGWHKLILVCHDADKASTLYTKHEVLPTIRSNHFVPNEVKFEKGNDEELYSEIDPEDLYILEKQKPVLQEKFDSENGLYLIPGQLSPYTDFILASQQFSSFVWINSAPQWQATHSGNILTVENMIRNYAWRADKVLTVVSGTYDILSLKESDPNSLLYLSPVSKKIPIPKYIWKFVYEEDTKSGIAFVTLNDPQTTEIKIPFCHESCDRHEWVWENSKHDFLNTTLGLTACCKYSDLRNKISYVPFLAVEKLLKNEFTGTDRYKKATSRFKKIQTE